MRDRHARKQGLFRVAIVAVVITSIAALPISAQPPEPGYILGPGDVLEISVWGYQDLTRQVAVRPDGKISVPLVGSVTAAGLSVDRLAQVLTRSYAEYIRNPQVTVIVKEFRKITASVIGQVARPGTYTLRPGVRLLDLLSLAGGVTEAAALKESRLIRPGASPQLVDLDRLLAGDQSMNIALQGGETLVVPEDLVNVVSILGEVAKPGRFRLRGEMRVLDVLLLAGGLTEKASITQARLMRDSRESAPLNLDRLLIHQDMSHNVVLEAGDALFIPEELNNKIYILGDVNRPGVVTVKGDVTLLQALAMAGGPVQRGGATAKSAHVVRRHSDPERAVATTARVEPLPNGGALITVDLQRLVKGDVTLDVPVRPGDVVVVPQNGLGGLQTILAILSGLLGIVR